MNLKNILHSVVCLFLITTASRALAGFETPALRLQTFNELNLPPQLTRTEIESLLNAASAQLHNYAFVDIGSMSDFMHAHVVFRPISSATPPPNKPLTSKGYDFDWSTVRLQAFLIHTQEYRFLRPNGKYIGANGELDPLARNWILWPASESRPAEPAHLLSPKYRDQRPHTVRVGDLDPKLFGENPDRWQYSFYFFRIDCGYADQLTPTELGKSSLVQVQVGGERACLNIVSFHCRNHPDDKQICGDSVPMKPYYSY